MFDKKNVIPIASDHGGFAMKEFIKKQLLAEGYLLEDFGTDTEESVDYPDYIHPLADAISKGKYVRGIILCGSGIGVSMVANRHTYVRAALCWNLEVAALCRQHNDANIISLPGRFLDFEEAYAMVKVFLNTEFEGVRHLNRIKKIELK